MKLNNNSGITIVEVLLTMTVISLVIGSLLYFFDPVNAIKSSRDQKRLSDLQTLDRAINEYFFDNRRYPGTSAVVYVSNVLPTGSTSPFQNASGGWIGVNLSKYFVKMPVDPLNENPNFYYYTYSTTSYELNAVLENSPELMTGDGGNDINRYELGNNLSLL